ncbi:MAG: hypothetical protein PWR01_2635 [Clostridiales bacterium]|nr:hypothetical protein [Clostridiales bacterium]MDN5281562.1 hypothetical protein [Candidatus Ozemobacter sp.]
MAAIEAEIKDGLLRTASGIAACLDGDTIATFDAPEKKDSDSYHKTLQLLQKARLATKHCTYLYVNRLLDDKVVFVLDPTPVDEKGVPLFTDEKNLEPSIPNTEYPGASKELIEALNKKKAVVSAEPYTDRWGTFYSAFVPIYDSQKRFVGTLGADLRINDMLARCEPIEDATKRAFFVSVILALLCGTMLWFTRRFSLQLNRSRIDLLGNLNDAKEFADQTSAKIGRQIQRISQIFKKLSLRLKLIADEKEDSIRQMKLESERQKLDTLSDKLLEAAELKFSRREANLDNFEIVKVGDGILQKLAEIDSDLPKINFSIDQNIPETLYGPVQAYEELLGQISSFFVKMFATPIECSIKMIYEGRRHVKLLQKVSAAIEGIDEKHFELLELLSREAANEDFFAELELADAVSVTIVRELVYLFNSDIKISINEKRFEISFEITFQKAFEEEGEEN